MSEPVGFSADEYGDAALAALIRERVSRPRSATHDPDDWRYGALTDDARLALRRFFPERPVPAAVLVPIVTREEGLSVLLTQRASHLRHHPGQISFPGGRIEPGDAGPVEAALREAREEIGLDTARIEIAGSLPDHLIVSGYVVTPIVGFVTPPVELRLDPTEVSETFEVPLRFVLDPRNHVKRIREFESHQVELTDIPYFERNIWGATAGMLMTFYRILAGLDR